ncbi:MAG TPA: hypothetical protein PKM34_02495 [Bacteroidales bacterium]|nr:hypothetical protein [Bacteroidales bacterium]
MKKIIITHYSSPDKTSLRTADRKYRVVTGFDNHTFLFETKREVEDFLRKLSQDMTDLLFLYNESFSRAFTAYRSLWFYMDAAEQSEINVNHDCDNLTVSLTRLFDRTVHWDHGGDAWRLTQDLRLIGNELKAFWGLLVKVTAKRNQWADNYRFKLEIDMVDNFRDRMESIVQPISDKEPVVTFVEMVTAKEILDHPVNLNSDYEKKKFASSLIRLRKQTKKEVINE